MTLSTLNKHFLVIICLLFMGGCASLPPNTGNLQTYALQDTLETRLGNAYSKLKVNHPEDSGFFLLSNGLDAFTARAVLAQQADKSIDVQYYMIHNDLTGLLFAGLLIQAADRGVRVRVLIDDMDLEGRDEGLTNIAAHPNIDVRVFNPFVRNTFRSTQLITRFGSVTRRMHNKSFTVDNMATIVGGRNIGNEYFEADPALAFADLDLLAFGAVVKEVSTSFDDYWNSDFSYPIMTLRPDLSGNIEPEEARKKLIQYLSQDSVIDYKKSLFNAKLAKSLRERSEKLFWGEARAYHDSPTKIDNNRQEHEQVLSHKISPFFEDLKKELLIFSPYFVPGTGLRKGLCQLSKSGVRVRILTNSLASTDVSIVHAGYAKYRKELLRCGVELYEMNKKLNKKTKNQRKNSLGSSKASLHAKSFVLDGEKVFVGSLNLDPRSIVENTEIGIMVSSKEVAHIMTKNFEQLIEHIAFRLELLKDDEGYEHIYWHGQEDEETKIWNSDPYTSFLQRFNVFIMSLLPIESQL